MKRDLGNRRSGLCHHLVDGLLRHASLRREASGKSPPDLCTGDHSCISLNGCPSLTLTDSPNPLREHSIVMVDTSCSGCGLCGEITVAAKLCPSFYEVTVVSNPTRWERLSHSIWRTVVGLADIAEEADGGAS